MIQIGMTVVVFALLSCRGAPTLLPAPENERITLAPGETARVADGRVQVRFDEIVSDSRCPTGEQCIAAGFAEVVITAGEGTTAVSYHVFTEGREPRSFTHAGHTVTLASLAPYPRASRAIPKDEYRATLEVSPNDASVEHRGDGAFPGGDDQEL